MMYQDKLAVAIKANGKVLREFKDTAYLPFGSEYSFLIKNLNTKRAVVKIEIDGRDVTAGGLVVNANSSIDLERFIGESLDKGNKFKFIERTASVEKHRGVGMEDGLVRIEFEYEKDYPKIFGGIDWDNAIFKGAINDLTYKGSDCVSSTWLSTTSYGTKSGDFMSGNLEYNCASGSIGADSVAYAASVTPKNDAGITVEGSVSDQRFITTHINTDGVKHVIVMKLLGETEQGTMVKTPITVKTRLECKYCGSGNKHDSKFCGECGAGLQIV